MAANKNFWTEEETKIMRLHYPTMPTRQLAKLMNRPYATIKDKATKLKIKKIVLSQTKWRQAEDKQLSALYPDEKNAAIAKAMGFTEKAIEARAHILGLLKSDAFRRSMGKEYGYKPGQKPANTGKKQHEFMSAEAIERTKATRFKKGQLPHNAKEHDGTIVIRHMHQDRNERPYKWIRVALGKWEMLHVHNWVKKYGPVPEGCVVVFKTSDTMNCEPENLECITRVELMKRNSMHRYPGEIVGAIRHLGVFNRRINKLKKQQHEK